MAYIIATLMRCARRNTRRFSAAMFPPIASFGDLSGPLKRFVLRVHPDIVQSFGQEVVDVNQASLQEVFKLFDAIKSNISPDGAKPAALQDRYQFAFYSRRSAAETDAADVGADGEQLLHDETGIARATVSVAIPPLFLDQVAILAQRGLLQEAQAHWLELGRGTLQVRQTLLQI
jgi:hypothetical protein